MLINVYCYFFYNNIYLLCGEFGGLNFYLGFEVLIVVFRGRGFVYFDCVCFWEVNGFGGFYLLFYIFKEFVY